MTKHVKRVDYAWSTPHVIICKNCGVKVVEWRPSQFCSMDCKVGWRLNKVYYPKGEDHRTFTFKK